MEVGKRFALLQCAEDPEHVTERYGGYLQVYMAMLAEEGEEWALFRVYRGEFPAEDEIDSFDGFVITASSANAHDNDAWICNLLSLVRRLDSMKKKVLGLCFGHQILGRAIGGKTGRSATGWDIGVTTVNFSQSSELLNSLKMPPFLDVLEFHQDEIKELPAEAEILAWSEKTGIEMFKYGDHMMGIQSHPEYTKDIVLGHIHRLAKRNLIQVHKHI
ncbi:unnamed protein product [Cuscuta campestris]|uniref:Glutamine amidotransferase domain-containing protein n=1 Tax=Cuscuta campestris TaxID=132261 RepID=A0A484KR21_9ASTE|nr:unnamed protein product [Cuscuta campestris]